MATALAIVALRVEAALPPDSDGRAAPSASAKAGIASPRPLRRHLPRAEPRWVARQNLLIDPWGRVVDLELSEPVQLVAPYDRFRFAVDVVQPLTRDGGACVGDFDGDGVRDLVLGSFNQEALVFPGIPNSPRHFGAGSLLRRQTAAIAEDSYEVSPSAMFSAGAIADLDGDGKAELVVGNLVYRNVGNAGAPLLKLDYTFEKFRGDWDPSASLGDLDGDGDLDVVLVYDYLGGAHLFWNESSPGHLAFTHLELYTPVSLGDQFWAPDNRLAVADLDGDGLLDLAGGAGIYRNKGTPQQPAFDFTSRIPWVLVDGPGPWAADNDLGTSLTLVDATGDGLVDAYVSGHDHTFWQVLFYRNVGTPQQPVMRYEGPVTVVSTPLCLEYRGEEEPSFSGKRAYAAAGDVDGDGHADIVLGTSKGDLFGAPGIVWNVVDSAPAGGLAESALVYPDLQTFPFMARVDGKCGLGPFGGSPDALCWPPNLVALWTDLTGDGKADALREDDFMESPPGFSLALRERQGSFPFTLKPDAPLKGAGSGQQLKGLGAVLLDGDGDGHADLVTGADDGTLLFHRNLATDGSLALADPVPLTDAAGTPINLGKQSWPTPFDLDGDGDTDLLVADYDGVIHKVLCQGPGRVNGWALGGLLGAREQDPVDVTAVVGGGHIGPALATLDVNHDGLDDVVMADVNGRVWWLENLGRAGAPDFTLRPLVVNRTAAAWLELLDTHTLRLRFGVPVVPGVSTLSFRGLTTSAGAVGGRVVIHPDTPPIPPVVPAGCAWHPSTDVPHTLVGVGPSTNASASSTLHVGAGGSITDVDVLGLTGAYGWSMYLTVELTSPGGTTVTLVKGNSSQGGFCFSANEWSVGFDDEATTTIPCPPTTRGRVRPFQPLAAFDGQSPVGDWRLVIRDEVSVSGIGSLNTWGLVTCQAP